MKYTAEEVMKLAQAITKRMGSEDDMYLTDREYDLLDSLASGTVRIVDAVVEPCDTCHGTGQVCVGTSGSEVDGNGPVMEPCPECAYASPLPAASLVDEREFAKVFFKGLADMCKLTDHEIKGRPERSYIDRDEVMKSVVRMRSAWDSWQAARRVPAEQGQSVIPEGFALVPVVPTDAMIASGQTCINLYNLYSIWSAMLIARDRHEIEL